MVETAKTKTPSKKGEAKANNMPVSKKGKSLEKTTINLMTNYKEKNKLKNKVNVSANPLTEKTFGEITALLPKLSKQEGMTVLYNLFEIDFIPDYEKLTYVLGIKSAIYSLLDENRTVINNRFSFDPETVLNICECDNEFSKWYREDKNLPSKMWGQRKYDLIL